MFLMALAQWISMSRAGLCAGQNVDFSFLSGIDCMTRLAMSTCALFFPTLEFLRISFILLVSAGEPEGQKGTRWCIRYTAIALFRLRKEVPTYKKVCLAAKSERLLASAIQESDNSLGSSGIQ